MRYIALLRGINVGGKNMLPMPELRAAFEAAGFCDVSTYINSGNLFFSAGQEPAEHLKARCEALIAERFSLSVPVGIFTAGEVCDALAHAPAWWNADRDAKHNAIFVMPPATVQQVFAQVGEHKPQYEKMASYGQVIFWTAPIKTFSRTRWSKVVGTSAYGSITIRNANTAIKLAQMAAI